MHWQSLLCRVLFLGHSAKRFAECQRALGKEKQPLRRRVTETASLPTLGKGVTFDECLLDSTRQRIRQGGSLCQVLCRVLGLALGKECLFAECQRHYTQQRTYTGTQVLVLCRVLWS
jgi:hypothetical protein